MDGIPPLRSQLPRRLLTAFCLTVCLLLILRAFFLESFQVPTGSMAPTLLGHHRSAVCPRCGFNVDVGRAHGDFNGSCGERYYSGALCPNCGCADLHLGETHEALGDQVLVNKAVYTFRKPRRWEVIVFRLFGKTYIKRLIGLGGEEIEIVDGDIFVDGKLVRKTLDDLVGMRVLAFDNDLAPTLDGWKDRWEYEPILQADFALGRPLVLDGRNGAQKLTYRHFSLDERKCVPITDEYAYNGPRQRIGPVHDFMAEADVEVVEGNGTLAFALTDGGVDLEVEVGVGEVKQVAVRESVNPEPTPTAPARAIGLGLNGCNRPLLLPGKRYHIEIALVDRRLTLRFDGQDVMAPLDLPEPKDRAAVTRPLRFTANGVLARLHHVRLYRDVHYTEVGRNAVRGWPVRLGENEGFALGDNSSHSEDSRFWPNQGRVPLDAVVGRAFFVHLPNRMP